jgi:hypothetical protein
MQKMSNFGCGEGVTEYLLTYFKLTKDWLLRTNSIPEFQKGWKSKTMNDSMSFTPWAQCNTTIQRPVRKCLPKGALIGMCLDIITEKKAMGKRSSWFDAKTLQWIWRFKPFNDDALFAK